MRMSTNEQGSTGEAGGQGHKCIMCVAMGVVEGGRGAYQKISNEDMINRMIAGVSTLSEGR